MHSDIWKGIPTNIFGGLYHKIYMIILHGNIPHEQTKNKVTIHGEHNNNSLTCFVSDISVNISFPWSHSGMLNTMSMFLCLTNKMRGTTSIYLLIFIAVKTHYVLFPAVYSIVIYLLLFNL